TPLLASAQPAASGNAGTPGVGTPAAGVPTASSQPLGAALGELSAATGTPIGFAPALVAGKTARTFSAGVTTRQALDQLL
ncbi:hypothetical protein Q6315_28920, partial [Klebsiella pneumoniae]|uniref:hypothetical protein n=1 Tax=Klebsiella pneumoniae TaxID=573 RepID=UPI002730AAB1